MRILITNDDGISSPVLVKLVEWAQKLGDVTVVAPKYEQSGKSQAIDFRRHSEIKRVDLCQGCEAYAMDSTPADCVRFAVVGLKRQYDIVFSGINRGYNLGEDIAYSGTAGATFEAARLGIKAIAFSTDVSTFEPALKKLDDAYSFIIENGLFDHAGIYNVNFPIKECLGICITRQGGVFFSDEFVHLGDDMYMQTGAPLGYDGEDITYDIHAVLNGYISVTPLTIEKTDLGAYEKIKDVRV